MNWLILSLPLISSLSLFAGGMFLFLISQRMFKDIKVPQVSRKEPSVEKVVEAFSKVFPETNVQSLLPKKVSAPSGTDVKLLGISIGFKNLALLEVEGRPIVLEEGEEKEGVLLARVYKDRAVVKIGGREVEIPLEKGRTEAVSPRKPVGSGEFKISRREIERITKDPGIMFREIRLVPYVKNGRTEGFIFEWIKPGSLFYRAGLRKGDVLVSINNMTIKSGEDAFRLLQVLRNEPSLRVVILRNGQRKELNIRIE